MKSENGVMECWRDDRRDARSSYGSADSLVAIALAEVNLVRVDSGRTYQLRKISSETRYFDQMFHLVSACFTWFQLSGKKNRVEEAENLRFQLRGTDAQQRVPTTRFTYACSSRDFQPFRC